MSRKDQAKTQTHHSKSSKSGQKSSSNNMNKQFTYAQLLCSPSTLSNLDRSPLPWFSDEIRMSDDPRVQWLDLSTTAPVLSQQDHLLSTKKTEDSSFQGSLSQTPNDLEETAVSGHYLDHIEAVQERDLKASSKRRRRSSKQKSKKKQVAASQKSKKPQTGKGDHSTKPTSHNRKSLSSVNKQSSTEVTAKKTEVTSLKSSREKTTSGPNSSESKSDSSKANPKAKSKRRSRSRKSKKPKSETG